MSKTYSTSKRMNRSLTKSTTKKMLLRSLKKKSKRRKKARSLRRVRVKKTRTRRKAKKTPMKSLLTNLSPSKATRMTKIWKVSEHPMMVLAMTTTRLTLSPMRFQMKIPIKAKTRAKMKIYLNKATLKTAMSSQMSSRSPLRISKRTLSNSRITRVKMLMSKRQSRKKSI